MSGAFTIALHALVYLDHKKTNVSSEELADNMCTNPVSVRRVMSCLKHAGLIKTKEGSCGGYSIAYAGEDMTLRDIAAAVGAEPVPSSKHYGNIDKDCMISSGMAKVMDGIFDDLNCLCMMRLGELSVSDISNRIFSK